MKLETSRFSPKSFLGFLFLSFFFWLISTSPVYAAVRTWDGGGATSNWSEDANWSSDTEPGTADVATFDATCLTDCSATIDTAVSIAGIDINTGYGGTISQSNGQGITVGSVGFDQASGTFTASDAPMTINGNFVLSAGTFTAPTAANMSVQGSWTHTAGGTFNHNSGTVRFINAVDTTINVATSETFYNIILEKTSNWQVTLASGDTAVVNNTLTLTDGRLMSAAATSIWEIKNTISVGSNWDSGTGNFKFSGTGDQSLTLISTSSWDPNGGLTIDKPSGTFTLGSALTLDCGGAGCNTTLAQGTFDLNGFALRTNDFTHTAGTFTSGASVVDVDDDLAISAGTWNASTGNTSIGGDFTVSAGAAFNDNSGTVTFDTAADQTINVDTAETFSTLIINKANFQETITTGDTVVVTNSLNLSDGRFTGGTIEMQGTTTTVGANYDSGTTLLKFTGTATQTLTLAHASANNFDGSITIDKTGGSVSLGTALVMNTGAPTFTLTQGTFSTGNYDLTVHHYTHNDGTFDGGSSATVDVNGTFTLAGGTYNATSGTTQIGETYTHTAGGTFNHSNGTWKFDTSVDRTYNVAVSETFYNLTVDKAGFLGTITSGDTFIVLNTLTCTDGRFGTGVLEARGDVVIGALCDTMNSPILFAGENTQTFTTSVNMVDADIMVNKTGGQVNQGSAVVLDCTNCDLFIQEGTYDLNGFNLNVAGSATERIMVESGGVLRLQGNETITADSASYPQLDGGSTVTYDGTSASYTLKDYTYQHLTIAGGASSVFALAANESLGGNLTITSGTLDQATRTLAVAGAFSNLGTLRRRQIETFTGTMDVDSGTVEYAGDGDGNIETITITDFGGGSTDYFNLKINDANATKDIFTIGAIATIAGTLQVTSSEFQQGTQIIIPAAITVDGGVFTGGSGAIAVSGAVTLSSGTLTSTSNTLQVSGAWTHIAGGTFVHNGGTVSFAGNAVTADVTTSETFNALTINKTDGQVLTIASGDTLVVMGTLTLTDGAFSTGTVNPQGNIVVGSGWDAGGSGAINVTGSGVQTLNLSAGAGLLDNPLTINKAGGSFTLASAYTLDHANADLVLTLGTFSTGGYTFTTASGSDVAVNGGIFNAGNATTNISGALTIAGGTYNADTSTPTFGGEFVLSSGAYTGSSNGDTFSGTLAISGGTFTASDATTSIANTFTHTAGGTFVHNSGTVAFTGNASSIDVATSETFSAVTINKSHGVALTIASGDSLISTGALTFTNGTAGTGTFEAQGAVSVGAGFDGGDAVLKFTGTNAQTFTLTGATGKYDGDIQIAKASNTVALGSALIMNAAGQDLTITSGTFNTTGTNYALAVAGNVAINGGTLNLNGSTGDMNGNISIGGGTLDMGSAAVAIAGDVAYTSGTMIEGTSSVTLDGSNQALSGALEFYNLAKTVVSAATLTFPADTVVTVAGDLNLQGASGQLLSLRSSSDGVRATITPSTVTAPNFLDIKDSTITKATNCYTGTQGCVNSLNNSGWSFQTSGGRRREDTTPAYLTITAPEAGESFEVGEEMVILWAQNKAAGQANILVSRDGGNSWEVIEEMIQNAGRYTWVIPESFKGTEVTLSVIATDFVTEVGDTTDELFIENEEAAVEQEDEETIEEEQPEETGGGTQEFGVEVGSLIKLADDGNPATFVDASVYFVAPDGKKHAFPSETVFRTWFADFSTLQIVSAETLAAIPLGGNITFRPGAFMVKFTTSNKVYAIDKDQVLRWIQTEEIAKDLYSASWNTKIYDIPDVFFGNYTFGAPVAKNDAYDPEGIWEEINSPSEIFYE